MTMRRIPLALRRTVRSLAVTAVLGALGAAPAVALSTAGGDPVTTVSDISVDAAGASGLLSVRAGGVPLALDPNSVTATVAGRPATVDVSPVQGARRTAMLVIDTSGSMGAAGMTVVRAAVDTYLARVPDDVSVGVVSFADSAKVALAPTTDRAAVRRVVAGLRSAGQTAMYGGVQAALSALQARGDRSMVLLADGENSVPKDPAAAAAQRAAALKAVRAAQVRLDVVAFTDDAAARRTLQQFAQAGSGVMIPAADRAQVAAAFTNSARALATQVRWSVDRPDGVSGRTVVKLAGKAAGQSFSTDVPILLGQAPGETGVVTVSTAATPGVNAPWLLPAAAVLVAVAVVVLVVIASGSTFRSTRRERIAQLDAYGSGTGSRTERRASQTSGISDQIVGIGDRVMATRESTSRTVQLLDRADLPWRPGEWFVLRVVIIVVSLALTLLLLGGILGGILGFVVGFFLPALWLRWKASRRIAKFENVLPDVLTVVASGLGSGFSFPQAIDGVARDGAEPAAKEFSRALAETRIGTDLNVAMERMADRMGSENLRWVTMAIGIQREVGGNLAETLRTTAATLRERQMLKRQVKVLSAEGRLSAYILLALPVGIFIYSYKVNYEYVSLLWTRPLGLAMSIGGLLAMGVGMFWMRKIVKIEV
jgi:tight adherence protein B